MDHITPDFSIKYDKKSAEAARNKLDQLQKEEAKLVEKLAENRKDQSVALAASKLGNEPGFSNAPSAKEQTAAQEESAKTSKATK